MVHAFWDTQPVSKDGLGEIDSSRSVRETPIDLPKEFEWSTCSIDEASHLLSSHYIRDEHFSLEYSKKFIEWATDPEWNLGIRTKSNGKLVGFISGVPCKYRFYDKIVDVMQANFLCVHDTLRNKRLTPLLISELARRSNLKGIWQAIATAVAELPSPLVKANYWHRLLNVPKLNRAKFSQERERPHIVSGSCAHRLITCEDAQKVANALSKHMSSYKVAPVIDETYVKRWLLPVEDIVYSYIDDTTGHFTSYYCVPYTSVKNGIHVKQAYMFYDTGKGDLKDAVLLARNAGFDVYNTLDVGLDTDILRVSRFMHGSGYNHCYVYNWSCGYIESEKIFMRIF